jgi:CheY-like chemotaxis protein
MDNKNMKKILVADDDRFMREMLRVVLAREGYELVFAENGAQAIELAAKEKPDLVLTDGLLPKMHGFVVCKTLKSSEEPPKVVLLTAVYTKPTYKWEVKKEYGADDILSKPVKSDALIACIRKHLGEVADDGAISPDAPDSTTEAAVAKAQAASSGASMAPVVVSASGPVLCEVEPSSPVTGFSLLPAA